MASSTTTPIIYRWSQARGWCHAKKMGVSMGEMSPILGQIWVGEWEIIGFEVSYFLRQIHCQVYICSIEMSRFTFNPPSSRTVSFVSRRQAQRHIHIRNFDELCWSWGQRSNSSASGLWKNKKIVESQQSWEMLRVFSIVFDSFWCNLI